MIKYAVERVTFDDKSMNYFAFGEGESYFIILPGVSLKNVLNEPSVLAVTFQNFAREHTVVVFERLNDMPEDYSVYEMAEDTAKAMKQLNISDAYIYGASQGGMMAAVIAARYPELVKKVVMASAPLYVDETMTPALKRWVELAAAGEKEKLVENMIDHLYGPATLDGSREYIIEMFKDLTPTELDRFRITVKACLGYDFSQSAKAIQCPVFFIGSLGDKLISPEMIFNSAKAMNSELFLYSGKYGHGVYDEAPDFRHKMLEFFDNVRTK